MFRRLRIPAPALLIATLIAVTTAQAQWTWTPEVGRLVNLKNLPRETPELQVVHARSLLIQGRHDNALQETDKFIEYYADSDFAAENQFLRGEIRLSQDHYLKSAEEFQQVVANYPDSDLYDTVIQKQYEIGDTLFDKGQAKMARSGFKPWKLQFRFKSMAKRPLQRAIEVYTMVIDNQPFTPAAAEAQYKIGRSHFAREDYLESAFEYRRVVEDYPSSPFVREASYGLTRCYEKSSLDPAYDQAPSELTIDTIREFKHRYPADPRIAGMNEVEHEMIERVSEQHFRTARFYEHRSNMPSARVYYDFVTRHYPDTEAAAKSEAWLAEHPPFDRLYAKFLGPRTAPE